MSSYTLTHNLLYNKLAVLRFPSINRKIFWAVGLSMILFLSIFYAMQIKEIIKGSYLIENYQKKINNLSQENKDLQITLAKMDFMGNIKEKTQELNFQITEKIKYIRILDSSLAKKE